MRIATRWENVVVPGIRTSLFSTLALAFFLLPAGRVLSQPPPYVLTSGDATLVIDPTRQDTGFIWTISGVGHLKELSNWYRVGSGGQENSVHTLNVGPGVLSGTDKVTVPYGDPLGRFALEIDYSVFGGPPGSGLSSFDEEIRITNLSFTTPLEFHFFEYVDLDLHQTPFDDTLGLTSANSLQQSDSQTVGNWSFNVDHYELDAFPNTLNHLTNGSPSTLGNAFGPGPIGPPADVTFALQWDFIGSAPPRPRIGPRQTAVITKEGLLQMSFVPEPTSVTLVILAVAMCAARSRRRSYSKRRSERD